MRLPVTKPPDDASFGETFEEASILCDLCGTVLYQPTPYGKPILNPSIRRAYGSAASVQVSLTAGEQEWDWGAGETTSFTICPKCFEEKLAAWFESQGALPKMKSWSR